jgi:glycosyltransferase involved in cell wall biosynthesis
VGQVSPGSAGRDPDSPVPGGRGAVAAPAKIAYVLGTSSGGTGRHVAMLAREFAARGVAVRVWGPAATGARFFPAGGLPTFEAVEIADRPRPARDLAAVRRLRRLVREWAPDVVHAHGLRAGGLTALAIRGRPRRVRSMNPKTSRPYPRRRLLDHGRGRRGAGGAGGSGGAALVVTVHNAPPVGRGARLAYAALERLAARRADAVTWVSGDLAGRMWRAGARGAGRALVPAPCFARPAASQVAAVRASLDAGHRPVVLAVGRLAAQKGFAVLLAAATGWQRRDPVPLLVIAGDGPLAGALAGEARASGIAVRFLGRRDDVPALLGAADVVVVPSLWEGQPLIVHETLRMGRPLVATRTGGIPEMTGEDAALLVPPADPVALAAAVTWVLDDPGRAAMLAAAATQRAGELPALGDAVDAVAALYGRLLRAAPTERHA